MRPRAEQLGAWAGAIGLALALFGLAVFIAPHLPIDPGASAASAIGAYLVAYACVGACVLGVGSVAPDLGRLVFGVVAIAALVLVSRASAFPSAPDCAIVMVALLAGGTAAGAAVGSRTQSAGHLLPVAVVSSLADLVSVLTPGAPSDVVAESPTLLSVLALSWPMPGTSDLTAILGVGDVAFVAIYFGAARKHRLGMARTFVALAIGLALAAAVVTATAMAIPALPFLGAAMVIAHPAARELPQKDRRPALIGLVVIAIALAALVVLHRAE